MSLLKEAKQEIKAEEVGGEDDAPDLIKNVLLEVTMPREDGTGPYGNGPVGWGLGPCGQGGGPAGNNRRGGRGRGMARGPGMGRGLGRGRGMGRGLGAGPNAPLPANRPPAKETDEE